MTRLAHSLTVTRVHLVFFLLFFFFNDTATTEIYTLSLHDALPISCCSSISACWRRNSRSQVIRHLDQPGRSRPSPDRSREPSASSGLSRGQVVSNRLLSAGRTWLCDCSRSRPNRRTPIPDFQADAEPDTVSLVPPQAHRS